MKSKLNKCKKKKPLIIKNRNQETQKPIVETNELKPEKFWGCSVPVENLTKEEFIQIVTQLATDLDFTYFGYIIKTEKGFNYHFGSYPRQILPTERYQEALKKLEEKLGVEGVVEKKSEKPRFRILLGLQEGYSEQEKLNIIRLIDIAEITNLEEAKKIILKKIKNLADFSIDLNHFLDLIGLRNELEKMNFGKDHSIEEVQNALDEEFIFSPAEICTIGFGGRYLEPAIIIEGDKSQVQKIYTLAINFHQARITVEDLQYLKSHILETEFCENSDNGNEESLDPFFY